MKPVSLAAIERAHAAMNAAYNSIALEPGSDGSDRIELARGYVREARAEVQPSAGHDGPHDAAVAARSVLPRLEHALQLLDALAIAPDPKAVAALLDELGHAMDHAEAVLAGAGWD